MLAEAGIACRRHKCAHLDSHGHVHMHPGLSCILWCSMDMDTCTVPTFPPLEFSWTCIVVYMHPASASLPCLLYNFHGHTFGLSSSFCTMPFKCPSMPFQIAFLYDIILRGMPFQMPFQIDVKLFERAFGRACPSTFYHTKGQFERALKGI